jgi:hypothetical protein
MFAFSKIILHIDHQCLWILSLILSLRLLNIQRGHDGQMIGVVRTARGALNLINRTHEKLSFMKR